MINLNATRGTICEENFKEIYWTSAQLNFIYNHLAKS